MKSKKNRKREVIKQKYFRLILLICVERLIGVKYPFFAKKYWNGASHYRQIVFLAVLIITFFLTFYIHFSRFPVFKLFCNDTQLHFMHIATTTERYIFIAVSSSSKFSFLKHTKICSSILETIFLKSSRKEEVLTAKFKIFW